MKQLTIFKVGMFLEKDGLDFWVDILPTLTAHLYFKSLIQDKP